ncbi:MAG: pyridoxal-phosphate dependent enzyme [Flavobacteriia bacterium]|nr:pyridoxal-phosphate dependent enzyme [Flavobacteriia bacterium]
MSNPSSFPSIANSIIEPIQLANNQMHQLFILRDDLIHDVISGNKWRKLHLVVERIAAENLTGIQTYGGAYSNHLLAVACAANLFEFKCKLVVRGEEHTCHSNKVLQFCHQMGAEIEFIRRSDFNRVKYTYGVGADGFLHIPEGGACKEGILGAMEIGERTYQFDIIALAQGTATTSLGVLLNSFEQSEIWVFPVIKGFLALEEMEKLAVRWGFEDIYATQQKRLKVFDSYHFGGYAKGLNKVVEELEVKFPDLTFPLDAVYTGKAFLGMNAELEKLNASKSVLFIHTGGYYFSELQKNLT